MPSHPLRGVALVAVLAVLLSGCGMFGSKPARSGSTARPSTGATADAPSAAPTRAGPAPTSLAGFYRQRLTWSSCRGGDRCARLLVPLDYAKPAGRAISVALLKVPATGPGRRLGSMVVDPGGPGASGVDYAASASTAFGAAVRQVHDVVGFDPRGVARSTPVTCSTDRQLGALVSTDPDPDTPAEVRTSDRLLRSLGQGCLRTSGGVVRHMSTVEVARDLDVLRAVLGDRRLTYFGASYGTAIGATYADLFPTHVGRMVLDGALDPRLSSLQLSLVQAHGFEVALRAYVGACVDRGGCFLGSSVDAGTRRIRSFLDGVERQAMPVSGGRVLDIGNATYAVSFPLYDKRLWAVLDKGLQNAFAGDGTLLMLLADAYLERNATGHFKDNSFQAFYAVSCLDRDDSISSSQVGRYEAQFVKASPTFGRSFAFSAASCASWPVHSGRQPRPVRATGAPPILIVGTTRDPATPLVWARGLHRQLTGSRLIVRDGDGHTGYRQGSSCVDHAVESYLDAGTVPRADLSCR